MEKKNPLQLQVSEPCHQPWADMKPDDQGRFCLSCTQTVVDFSTYTDEQLIAYFTNKQPGRVCGRFSTAQLDRPLKTTPTWRRWIQTLASLLLPLLIQFRADAQRLDSVAQVGNRQPEKIRTGDQPIILGITFPSGWIEKQRTDVPPAKEVNPRDTYIRRVKGKVSKLPADRPKE